MNQIMVSSEYLYRKLLDVPLVTKNVTVAVERGHMKIGTSPWFSVLCKCEFTLSYNIVMIDSLKKLLGAIPDQPLTILFTDFGITIRSSIEL